MTFLLFALLACDDAATSGGTINGQPATAVARPAPKPYDPIAVAAKAEAYVSQLYGSKSPNGPVCFPEAMQGDSTQCSFTYLEGTVLQAGTITCSARGCVSGEIKPVPAEDVPQVIVQNTGGSHNNNEWMYWYLLYNTGGTTVHYNTWYTTTPAVGRTSYTSTSYTPTAASTSYYRSTYKAPVTTTTAARTSTTTPSTKSATSTSTTTAKPATSTSTGWGKSTRSTGYKSSGGSGSSSRSSGGRR